jgi:hypothetical protein
MLPFNFKKLPCNAVFGRGTLASLPAQLGSHWEDISP